MKTRGGVGHVIVLAAGRGTRAGGPKALFQLNGAPWWRTQFARLERTGLPVTWVVSERVRAEMVPATTRTHLVLASDASPMFASVIAGAEGIRQLVVTRALPEPPAAIYILPVDVPAPKPDVFTALAATLASAPATTIAAQPEFDGKHGHPVALRWDAVLREVLGEPGRLEGRLDHLIAGRAAHVPVDDDSVTTNLNAAADFTAWASANTAK